MGPSYQQSRPATTLTKAAARAGWAALLVISVCSGAWAPPAQATSPKKTVSSASPAAPVGGSNLAVEAAIEPVITDNFNPFDDRSPLEAMGVPSFIYEPLVQYDELQVNQYYPWLAQSWTFSSSGQTITFSLRAGVTWDNGSPLTATDVAYTFNLLRANPALADGLPIVSAVATNPTTFTLTLSKPAYTYLYDIAKIPIVHNGFALSHALATYVVKDPDGTGPYALAKPADITRSRVVLTARAHYWQKGVPAISTLAFPAYKDVAAAGAALAKGELDWAGNFMPAVSATFEAKDKSLNHFWAPPVNCIALQANLSRYPLDQLAVREALSVSIGRAALSQKVTSGYDPPATTSSALVTPLDNQYLTASQGDDIDTAPELDLAAKIMASAGFSKDAQGYWQGATGLKVAFSISAPAGTVYASTASALAVQLRAAGFDVSVTGLASAAWAKNLATGNYDSALSASPAGPTPYYMYDYWLSSPAATGAPLAYLSQYEDNPPGSGRTQAAIVSLANYVSAQLPVIPLLYGAAWAEFSTRHASGWPNGSNPYEPASPVAPFDEYTVLQLTPTS